MEKISVSAFLLLVALSYTLAKDTTVKPGAKKDTKDSRPKLPQTLSRVSGVYSSQSLLLLFNSSGSEFTKASNILIHFVLGWGDQLIWTQTYEEALYKSKTSNKPLMIIHHLDECPHSQALKKVFAENKEIQKLAEQFVLLNLVYETTDKHLSPDGQYVPRIMFVDPSLTVRADITGRYSNRLYAYEPSDTALLLDNMKKALKLLKTEL
ncbi:Anterior gradient protein 2 [Saguinus oedipus]|uniref:Anterior gradient protein 2 n=1 Tax=Saguinus oedipus TaxID=9490 RepID=A0ABQ9UIY9_SAGOE|nr:Anterior gradient protein 2 [Saguinus oedipus]